MQLLGWSCFINAAGTYEIFAVDSYARVKSNLCVQIYCQLRVYDLLFVDSVLGPRENSFFAIFGNYQYSQTMCSGDNGNFYILRLKYLDSISLSLSLLF